MQTKVSNANRHSGIVIRSRTSTMLSMFATLASFKLPAGELWQDAEERVLLTKELDRITGQGHSAISVDDTLKIIACREQKKKLSALEMELVAARQEGFVSILTVQTAWTEALTMKIKRPMIFSFLYVTHLKNSQTRQGHFLLMLQKIGMLTSFAKINDDVFLNIDALGNTLARYADKSRVYVGCMMSGEVFSEQ
ncbi:unnamed protein product [Coffea canephora]|uniref:Uncharacterized protein n=1 Tax=Coffea canephora TaxID=49390 RepID=A0A068UB00_COFCA|nr:unnamed protein product [Coffea canephora]